MGLSILATEKAEERMGARHHIPALYKGETKEASSEKGGPRDSTTPLSTAGLSPCLLSHTLNQETRGRPFKESL